MECDVCGRDEETVRIVNIGLPYREFCVDCLNNLRRELLRKLYRVKRKQL